MEQSAQGSCGIPGSIKKKCGYGMWGRSLVVNMAMLSQQTDSIFKLFYNPCDSMMMMKIIITTTTTIMIGIVAATIKLIQSLPHS